MKSNVLESFRLMFLVAFVGAVMLTGTDVFAITSPTSGTFAYSIFDLAVNDILSGPIGFVAGVGAVVWGAMLAMRNQYIPAIGALLSGGALLGADSIVQTMGIMIV